MENCRNFRGRVGICSTLLAILAVTALFSNLVYGQSASTGALAGKVFDPSGALVRHAEVRLIDAGAADVRSDVSDAEGNFHFLLLLPGSYELEISKAGFARLRLSNLNVLVTETLRLDVHLRLASVAASIDASSEGPMVQPGCRWSRGTSRKLLISRRVSCLG
jgi:hypothetical protein